MKRRGFLAALLALALAPAAFLKARRTPRSPRAWDGVERRRFIFNWQAGGRRRTDRVAIIYVSTLRVARGVRTLREMRAD